MNKLCYFIALRKTTTISSSFSHHGHLWFSSNVKTLNPFHKPHFLVEYLINSCGLSPEKATNAAKYIPKLKSPSNPDFVLGFLREIGFGDVHIAKFLSKDPRFLSTSVDKVLKPKVAILEEMGFSLPEIADLVSHSPTLLWCIDLKARIEFWKSLMDNHKLIKACRRDNYLLSSSLTDRILPNISLLRERGVPDSLIVDTIVRIPRLITRDPKSFEELVKRIEEVGFTGDMPMYSHALHFAACNTREAFEAKSKLLMELGWPESYIMSVLRKHPKMFNLTEKNLRHKMEFYIKEVGFDISFLLGSPVLLDLSLERRLRPRHYVLRVLNGDKSKVAKTVDFTSSEKIFLERYVFPHREKVPGLYEAYVAACAGNQGTETKEAAKDEAGPIKKQSQMQQSTRVQNKERVIS